MVYKTHMPYRHHQDINYLLEKIVFTVYTVGNQSSNNQTVDSDNTSHDNGDDGFHDKLRSHDRHRSDTCARFSCPIGCSQS